MRDAIIQRVYRSKLIAIVRGVYGEPLLRLADALAEGGIDMMEITFDQAHAEDQALTCAGITGLIKRFEGRVMAGAGTVTTVEMVKRAADAGAQYIISPDVDPAVIQKTREMGLVSMPGAMTPTEIRLAYDAGADFVKVFPAGCLGAAYVKAIKAPLNHIPLLAVGGVNESNIASFLAAGCVGAGIGGNLVNQSWLKAGEYAKLTAAARAMRAAAQAQ